MKILKDLLSEIKDDRVKDVIIGVFSTLVWSRNCGISSTQSAISCHINGVKDSASLTEKSAGELAEYVLSSDILEASLGMAAINSTIDVDLNKPVKMNAKELIIQRGKGRKVGIIGHFPFINKIKDNFKELYVFEKTPLKGDLMEQDIPEYLPQADVVAISGTTLSNHTFEDVIKNTRKDSFKIMLGPSTPLSPVLFNHGIDAVAGSFVRDIPAIILQVKGATPFKFLKGVDHLMMLKDNLQ